MLRHLAANPVQCLLPLVPQIIRHETEVYGDPAVRPAAIPRSLPIPETHRLVPFQHGSAGSACRDRPIMLTAPLPLLPLA
jgi:hypothetical protein